MTTMTTVAAGTWTVDLAPEAIQPGGWYVFTDASGTPA